ncbi:MAG: hypothetical protein OXJ53_10700 [Gammaproteobacteria bacterium]|nr:hypothetical protein [Gammaproteobacteria bacterium]MDE0272401.1 hypothetical protein [Gammaproteobacteria bacterium]
MKLVNFDRSAGFLNEELLEATEALRSDLKDNQVVAYALCAIFEDGMDARAWSVLDGVHDLALIGSLASLQQQLIDERNDTEEDEPDPDQ